MSFFQKTATQAVKQEAARALESDRAATEREQLYHELITQRPALLDQKLKLHAQIIDDFNLASLEKLPRPDLVREVHRAYVKAGAEIKTQVFVHPAQ